MRRAVVLALVGLAVGAAPALADPGIAFQVDGRSVVVSAQQLAAGADVTETTYVVDGVPQTLSGTSLRTALALSGADPDAISAVTASAELALLQLTRPDVAAVAPYPEGPALVWVDAEGRTALLRPTAASGRPAQVIRSAPGAPLAATIEGATLAEVAIIASVEQAEVGERVPLMAQGSAQDATYTWDFGDGSDGEGEQVEHRFTRPGRYRVTVTAPGAGTSRPVTIVVAARRQAAQRARQARAAAGPATEAGAAAAPVAPVAPKAEATPAPAPADAPQAPRRAKPKRQAVASASRSVAAPAPDPGAVSGTLIADVSPAPSRALGQAAVAAPAPIDDGWRVAPIVWIALGAVGVLALGVLGERRRR